ncbi:hypothetical protein KC338_g210 [Hortaea werneckii]|nr:hypothetical protein KC338_g210 [Hortaea werneckii]
MDFVDLALETRSRMPPLILQEGKRIKCLLALGGPPDLSGNLPIKIRGGEETHKGQNLPILPHLPIPLLPLILLPINLHRLPTPLIIRILRLALPLGDIAHMTRRDALPLPEPPPLLQKLLRPALHLRQGDLARHTAELPEIQPRAFFASPVRPLVLDHLQQELDLIHVVHEMRLGRLAVFVFLPRGADLLPGVRVALPRETAQQGRADVVHGFGFAAGFFGLGDAVHGRDRGRSRVLARVAAPAFAFGRLEALEQVEEGDGGGGVGGVGVGQGGQDGVWGPLLVGGGVGGQDAGVVAGREVGLGGFLDFAGSHDWGCWWRWRDGSQVLSNVARGLCIKYRMQLRLGTHIVVPYSYNFSVLISRQMVNQNNHFTID